MTKVVLPSDSFTQYQISCPKCGWKWYFIKGQLEHPQFTFVCDCKTAFKPRLTIPDPKIKEQKPVHTSYFDQVLANLIKLGFSKDESLKRLSPVFSPDKDIETILSQAIFRGC